MVTQALKLAWARWKVIAHTIADFQARVVLSAFYFVLLGPFALGVKMLAYPLRIRPASGIGWLTRVRVDGDPLALASRQF